MKRSFAIYLLVSFGALVLVVGFLFMKDRRQQQTREWALVDYYKTENEALLKEPVDPDRVVFIGNSITKHWLRSDKEFFTSHKYINRGIIAQTTPQFLGRFKEDVINLCPRIVVIGGGINDIAENTGRYDESFTLRNIISMVELSEAHNIKVILTSVLPATTFDWNLKVEGVPEKVKSLNKRIKEYADNNNITYVDYYSPLVDENNAFNPQYTEDGVHPNGNGYLIMKPLIHDAITTLLQG